VQLLLAASLLTMQQSIDISWPLGLQQQTCSSSVQQPDRIDGWMDGHIDRCIDLLDRALHAMQAVPIM